MSWTDERVEILKRLWGEGLSASQIAGELGGVTRNGVIGKVHRLGLSGRVDRRNVKLRCERVTAPAQRAKRATTRTRAAAAADEMIDRDAAAFTAAPDDIVEAPLGASAAVLAIKDAQCKWPLGDPLSPEFRFCCAPADAGPYCGTHFREACDFEATARASKKSPKQEGRYERA